jgi:hypothetical protein
LNALFPHEQAETIEWRIQRWRMVVAAEQDRLTALRVKLDTEEAARDGLFRPHEVYDEDSNRELRKLRKAMRRADVDPKRIKRARLSVPKTREIVAALDNLTKGVDQLGIANGALGILEARQAALAKRGGARKVALKELDAEARKLVVARIMIEAGI